MPPKPEDLGVQIPSTHTKAGGGGMAAACSLRVRKTEARGPQSKTASQSSWVGKA